MMSRFPLFSRSPLALGLALYALWGAGTPVAHAQPEDGDPVARARVYFEAAMAYFDEGEYEAAIPQFERALELTTAPEILYNLYIAHERIGQFDKAAVYLRTYISVADETENREQLLSRLEALERRADRSSEPEEPLDEQAPARELPQDAQPRTAEDEPPPTSTEGSSERSMVGPIVSYLVAGAGVVALAVGGALALKRDSDLANDCGELADRSCSDDDVAPLRRASITADVGLGVAIAGALVGTLLVLLKRPASGDTAAVELAPAVGRNEGGLVLHGRF
jgi:tetratricopeptide (TPR) repeat protein